MPAHNKQQDILMPVHSGRPIHTVRTLVNLVKLQTMEALAHVSEMDRCHQSELG